MYCIDHIDCKIDIDASVGVCWNVWTCRHITHMAHQPGESTYIIGPNNHNYYNAIVAVCQYYEC